jgi:hypothetical protein
MQIAAGSSNHSGAMPPSRRSNPFATCWTRPGALGFRFTPGDSAELLVARLSAANWRGAIVGPHGSGKTTLLATLRPHFSASDRTVSAIALRGGQRRLPRLWLRNALATLRPLVIIDGYEQLSWHCRALVSWRCVAAQAGLVVTSHSATSLPTLVRLEPDLRLAEQLVSSLTARTGSLVTVADIAASHACHGSNLRELFFDLYDRHEQRGCATRTCALL